MTRSSLLRRFLAHVLFVCAALVLSLAPSIDSMAGAAKAAVESGHASSVLEVVAAFDVVDDTLDHLPGKSGGEPQQQLILPLIAPYASPEAVAPRIAGDGDWTVGPPRPLASRPYESPERPPRA